MNSKLVITGTLRENLFGLSWLKRNIPVHETLDLSSIKTEEVFPIGPVTVGASVVETDSAIELQLAVGIYGLPLYNKQITIDDHIAQGPQPIKIGSGQLEFDGTVQVLNTTPAQPVAATEVSLSN